MGLCCILTNVQSSIDESPLNQKEKVKYRSSFGYCPSRTAGTLTLKLVKTFEENRSLKAVKEKIINDNLLDEHFISDY